MRLLLTSDWQCAFDNRDECEVALTELLAAAEKYHPDCIINAGDCKDQYDPVSLTVVKFWVRAIKKITGSGFRFIILKGNHDRISQSAESKDWLDVLRAAGAETVSSKPTVKHVGDDFLFLLPFTSDKKQELAWAKELSSTWSPATSHRVLIFHTEVAGAQFGNGMPTNGSTPEALCFDSYEACLGGHIHKHQQICDNAWYLGSPFSMEWGDVNQAKGHVLVDINDHVRVRQLKTSLPSWYDADFLAKHKITPEPGAYIRSKVEVSTKKISDQLRKEEARLLKLYGDKIRPFVVPNIIQSEDDGTVQLSGTTDKDKIFAYLAATMPAASRFDSRVTGQYMSSRLSQVGPEVCKREITVDQVVAKNVLSFSQVEVNYRDQGLVLIRGVNKDWPKRSNGAGKTNFLSLLSIGWFGQNMKSQNFDAWTCERNEDEAEITLRLTDDRNRHIEIYRARRGPRPKILLRVNGKDQSSGITGKGKDQTQGHIVKLTGFDYQMLTNGVYIDQSIANSFVFGTNKMRMDLVAKIQNLERFAAARDAVAKDIAKSEKAYDALSGKIEQLEEDVSRVEAELVDMASAYTFGKSTPASEYRKQIQALVKAHAAIANTSGYYKEVQEKADDCESDYSAVGERVIELTAQVKSWRRHKEQGERLVGRGSCPECGQPATEVGKGWIEDAIHRLEKLEAEKQLKEKEMARLQSLKAKYDGEIESYKDKLAKIDRDLSLARSSLEMAELTEKEDNAREAKQKVKRDRLEKELRVYKKRLASSQAMLHRLAIDREMLEYARKGFSRDGIPLFLSAWLCPILNRSAEDYSELLTSGKLGVHFAVTSGEFEASIVNPSGSSTTGGQSVGEAATAGLITALAVREISAKCNLLILDEPGHGLDAEGAKVFAQSLLKLKSRFPTILVTTHNPAIESVLSGEKTWVVEKVDGISRLIM
jgi:DNA repair exonuclease SbcCD ATPase subunit/DNA repair exonuclease SbcCD nuclease subunit